MMAVLSNILDDIHDTLTPAIWEKPGDPEPVLKAEVAHFIKGHIYPVLEKHGYSRPHEWLNLCLTGSLTTYQYSKESDCDVALFVNAEKLPEWSRAEMIGLMVSNVDGTIVPGSSFPLQDFVVGGGLKPADLYQLGLRSGYDIDAMRWIVPPDRSHTMDVKTQENGFYVYAMEVADKMHRLFQYEPDKAVQFWHAIHRRRMADMTKGKGDFCESNIVYKFLAQRGLLPEIARASGEYIAKVADVMAPAPGQEPLQQPIRPSELSSPTAIARGHSRPVTAEQWQEIAAEGKTKYEAMSANADGTQGMDANWPALKEHAWQSVQQPWGGATINAATGGVVPEGADLYALTVKHPGIDTVSIPINSPREHFMAAMDEARNRFSSPLALANHHLGVFRDHDVNRIDLDPVMVVNNLRDAESIGAHSRNVGGAYHFKSGDGFWPPHVPEHLGATGFDDPAWLTHAQFRSLNRTEPIAPVWFPQTDVLSS